MKKKIIPFIAAIALIIVVVLFMVLGNIIEKYTPSKETKDLSEYYGLTSDTDVALICNNEVIDTKGKLVNGEVYLSYETVRNYLNARFYWDPNENILRYTTANDLISVNAESSDYTVNKDTQSFGQTIVKADASTAYIAIDFVKQYSDFQYNYYTDPNRVVLTNAWGDYTIASAKQKTEIRYQGGIKSPILTEADKNTELTILEPGDTWTKVATNDGYIGYIKSNKLGTTSTTTISSDYVAEEFSHITKDYKINMAWHQVTNQSANDNLASILQKTKGINVLSPTWFYLNDNNGNIASLASSTYVDYCHQNGIEVWALISNLENDSVNTAEVLSHTSSRDNLTNNIISAAIQYNLDGINVDFEALNADAVGNSYIQFIRELSLKCANNGIVLSVDNYVPSDYTAFYNRAEQALFADYVVIMAYDEHYAGSPEAGSVASIGFVTDGVENTLKEVPANQVILGMPFYTRVWSETPVESDSTATDETDTTVDYELSSYATNMTEVQKLISANGVQPVWLDDIGQNYVDDSTNTNEEYSRNYIRHRILPEMEHVNQKAAAHISELGMQMQELLAYVTPQMEKLYNENVIANEQGELFLAEKTFSVMSLFEQKEMMRRMLFEISGHRKDISLIHVEQLLALMANKEGKQQNCPYGVLAKRVRDGLLLMKLSTDVTFSDKNKQKDGQQKSDEQNLENLNKKNKKCGNHSEDKMQPVYLQLTAESEESKAEETIVLSNETLLQKFTIHFSILPWNGGKVAKRDCVKYFDYDKMKCKPCLRTRDTGDYFIMDKEGRRKSLGRYFIDTKIPASDRDGQLLLADGSHIMWIIGGRISEFYKVSSETKRVLRVSVQEKEEN